MSKRNHQLRRFREHFVEAAWAIVPERLEELAESLWDPTQITLLLSSEAADEGDNVTYGVKDGVALIAWAGPMIHRSDWISSYFGYVGTDAIEAKLGQALRDPKVKSIVLGIDSPGGSVLGTSQLSSAIFAARGQKPITAVADGMACSAAYWVGTAADSLLASPGSLVGSVGVYSVHREFSRALENLGIKSTVIKAGKLKATGNPFEPLSGDGRQAMQDQVDAYFEQFVGDVARNRGTSAQDVKDNYGQGMSVVAEKALPKGMIDGVATLNSAIEAAIAAIPHTPPAAPGVSFTKKGGSAMDPRLKAQMIAAGLIEAEATDETAQAVLKIFYASHGKQQPAKVEEQLADVAAVLAPKPVMLEAVVGKLQPAPQPEPAKKLEQNDALAERNRVLEIQARGKLLGVSAEAIDVAVANGDSLDAFLRKATETKAAEKRPIAPVVTGSSSDAFADQALEAMLARAYPGAARDERHVAHEAAKKVNPRSNHLANRSLIQIAAESLRMEGVRVDNMTADDIAQHALAAGPSTVRFDGAPSAYSSNQLQAPGSFPNLLSSLMGKMMDNSLQYAPATYREWAVQIPSVPDFKPKTLIATGEFAELPEHADGRPFDGSKISEEASFIQVQSYGDEWSLTPRMLVDDDLNALIEAGSDKAIAHEMTMNRLCVALIANNTVLVDAVALFHATHANLVSSGAAPSVAEMQKIRLLFRRQTGVSAKRKLNLDTQLILVPPALEDKAEQTLATAGTIVVPVPTADTSINQFRGRVRYVVEPMLEDYTTGTVLWYAFANPQLARAIIFCYQQGYESMQRRLYFDPKTNCRVLQVEGRMAAAVRQWRGVVRNNGQ